MTDKTIPNQTTVQVTYNIQGSPGDGFRIERTEHNGMTVHERLGCLFSDVRTLHKALVAAAVNVGKLDPHRAHLDANTVILQLVVGTLKEGDDNARLEFEDLDELAPLDEPDELGTLVH